MSSNVPGLSHLSRYRWSPAFFAHRREDKFKFSENHALWGGLRAKSLQESPKPKRRRKLINVKLFEFCFRFRSTSRGVEGEAICLAGRRFTTLVAVPVRRAYGGRRGNGRNRTKQSRSRGITLVPRRPFILPAEAAAYVHLFRKRSKGGSRPRKGVLGDVGRLGERTTSELMHTMVWYKGFQRFQNSA